MSGIFQALWFDFLSTWVLGFVATLIAFFWRPSPTSRKLSAREVVGVGLATWVFAFFVSLVSRWSLHAVAASEANITTFGWFAAPIVAGVWFARIRFSKLRSP